MRSPPSDTSTELDADALLELAASVDSAPPPPVPGPRLRTLAAVGHEAGDLCRALADAVVDLWHRAVAVAAALLALAGTGDDDRWWEGARARLRRRATDRRRRAGGLWTDVEPAATAGPADGAPARRTSTVGQVLAAGLCAFGLWLLLDAPTLLRTAEASPLGARRTAAMVLLRPIAAASRDLGLSHVVGAADRVLGRTGDGVVQVAGPPVHRRHRAPAAPAAPAGRAAPGPAPTDALPPLPAPSAAAPLRVLAVGDSLGVDFGGPFVNDLAATGVVAAALDARVDTGLSRPDYFDWPGELQADLARYQPQVVVVLLGANDPQNFVEGGTALAYGTPEWSAAYARRVGALMQEATGAGARVLWLGLPPMADPALTARMQVLNGIDQSQAAAHPGVTFLPSWPVLSDSQGGYAQYLSDAAGNQVTVREPDGTHISPGGAERLAQAVIGAVDRSWGLTLQP